MDVHSTNYTLCAIEPRFDGDDTIYANVKVTSNPNNIMQFIEKLKSKIKDGCDILCGYEAGYLGFSLYHELAKKGDPLHDSGSDYNADTAGKKNQNG